ncbi:MAG: hypothetical protein IPL52_11130 [Flavobacteriales bacterium]|nr:hypothetical protein [Flavobacteriales bacterium]
MTLEEASFNNTLRTIAVLLIAWWLLRLLTRARTRPVPPGPQRPPGDVRIERPPAAPLAAPTPASSTPSTRRSNDRHHPSPACMKANPWKIVAPVASAIALFYLLCLVYFSPVLGGKQLVQGDIRNFRGMVQEIVEHRELNDNDPLWTGSMFSGMPAYQIECHLEQQQAQPRR